MTIMPGEHVAICGRTGSGKSSTVLALLQMLDVLDGTITIDGVDLATADGEEVRKRVSVVSQDPFLLPGTLRFNIDPLSRVSDDVIAHALSQVGLWDNVQEQGGLDSKADVSDWSVGERQLICVARALTRQAKVVIFDEATSKYVPFFPQEVNLSVYS